MAVEFKSAIVQVRFTPSDVAAVEKAAAAEDMSRSEYIRAAVLAYMALRMDKHALNAVLTGAQQMLREFEQEGVRSFLGGSKRVKA